jgi:hypothetical protein
MLVPTATRANVSAAAPPPSQFFAGPKGTARVRVVKKRFEQSGDWRAFGRFCRIRRLSPICGLPIFHKPRLQAARRMLTNSPRQATSPISAPPRTSRAFFMLLTPRVNYPCRRFEYSNYGMIAG